MLASFLLLLSTCSNKCMQILLEINQARSHLLTLPTLSHSVLESSPPQPYSHFFTYSLALSFSAPLLPNPHCTHSPSPAPLWLDRSIRSKQLMSCRKSWPALLSRWDLFKGILLHGDKVASQISPCPPGMRYLPLLPPELTHIRGTSLVCFGSIICILYVGIWGIKRRYHDKPLSSRFFER